MLMSVVICEAPVVEVVEWKVWPRVVAHSLLIKTVVVVGVVVATAVVVVVVTNIQRPHPSFTHSALAEILFFVSRM